jgi:PhzF family phenazine biosynthesis protein
MKSLGLDPNDLYPGFIPVAVNTGNTFLMIPLVNLEVQRHIIPDFSAITKISGQLNMIGYYTFSLETIQPGRDAAARMFAPLAGINEESATGTAAGPLAGYLYDVIGLKKTHFEIEQGRLIQPESPSRLMIDLNIGDGQIEDMMVGGKAIEFAIKTIHI